MVFCLFSVLIHMCVIHMCVYIYIYIYVTIYMYIVSK